MSRISFKRINPDESRIYDDGDCIGEVCRHPDILNPGRHFYVVHLDEDPRGWVRVHDRRRIRDVAQERWDSHPYY